MTHSASDSFFFFFNDTATTEIYTLSLHDALPIWSAEEKEASGALFDPNSLYTNVNALAGPDGVKTTEGFIGAMFTPAYPKDERSEEHTSELQSRLHLVCRLLLEKKKKQ